MRITHVSAWLSQSAGGMHFSVSGLAQAQRALGAEVSVVGGADSRFVADRAVWNGLDIDAYPVRDGSYGLDLGVASRILRQRPDILHVHGIWNATSIYGRLAAALGVPVIVSPRGMLEPWILARRKRVKAVHAALWERPLLARAHVHALTEAERQSALDFMPALAQRNFVLPNGIGPVSINDVPRSGALFLGRLHEKKQVVPLLQHWQKLPGTARLTIAGWGSDEDTANVRSAVDGQRVNFVGALDGDGKVAAFASARFFILPSLSEGMPMAVLEAMAAGCVPIITPQCNLPELFADNVALAIRADFSDFSQVMSAAFAMPEDEFQRRSRHAKSYARRYQWPVIAAQMLDRYRAIAGENSGA